MKQKTLVLTKGRLAALLCVCSLTIGNTVSAQNITLKKRKITLSNVFDIVYEQTGYGVSGASALLKEMEPIDVDVKEMALATFMNHIMRDKGLVAKIEGKSIFLYRTAIVESAPAEKAAQQERITISGTIVDSLGRPIPTATISIVGQENLGVSTNDAGFFLFSNVSRDAVLNVSSIGFNPVRFNVNYQEKDKKSLPRNVYANVLGEYAMRFNVVLSPAKNEIDEVVVTGYMDIDKSRFTGSSFTIKAEDIKIAGETSIDMMLQGVVPGMLVTMQSGQVGSTPKIRVRGTSTLLGNQEPLWVVDGIVQRDPLPMQSSNGNLDGDMTNMRMLASNAISWLNPSDIETITVLKDASATAIYGSQAANGVIVIKTKKAKPGTVSVSYGTDLSLGRRPRYSDYNFMNSQELMQFSQELYENRDSYTQAILPFGYGGLVQRLQAKEIDYDTYVREFRKLENQNTDWFDLLFTSPISQNHNVNISGGTERIVNRTGFGFQKQIGEAKGNNLMSFTGSSNTTVRFGDNLSVNLLLNGGMRQTDGFAFGVNPFDYASKTSRTLPMYNDNGTLFFHEKIGPGSTAIPGKNSYLYNIQNELDNTGNVGTTRNLSTSADIRYKVHPDFEYQGLFSFNVSHSDSKMYATELSNYITQIRGYEFGSVTSNSSEEKSTRLPFGGLVVMDNAVNTGYTFRNNIVYNKVFEQKHHITVQLGIEARSGILKGNIDTRYGYLHYRGEKYAAIPQNPVLISNTGAENLHEAMRSNSRITNRKSNYLSEYFSGVYGYDNRYVVNVSGRLDASNRFGQDQNKRFAPTWSVGGKWLVGNEKFFKSQTWMGSLDIYGSYGFQGNAVEAVSPYLIARDGGLNTYFQQYTLNIQSLPYPNLGWEKTKSWNLGVDISFLNGRLNATANMFRKNGNILSSREVPIENGMASAIVLGSRVENKGYDLIVNIVPVRTKDFTWQFSVNTGLTRNKLFNNDRVNTRADYLNGTAIETGEAYSTFYSYAYNGLKHENGMPSFKYMDVQKSNNDLDYLVNSGKIEPDFSGGLSTSLRYKNISFRAQFAMAFGNQKRLPRIYNNSGAPTPEQNVSRLLIDRWKKPGDEAYTNIPSVPPGSPSKADVLLPTVTGGLSSTVSAYEMYAYSDYRVADADFIRCRTIGFTYDLSADALKKLRIKRLSISGSLTNPFLITFDKTWDGYDPETGGWPARRTGSLGLNLSF